MNKTAPVRATRLVNAANEARQTLTELYELAEHIEEHVARSKQCSVGGGCCREMAEIDKLTQESHGLIHQLMGRLDGLMSIVELCKNCAENNGKGNQTNDDE